jgi:hypothetical protein
MPPDVTGPPASFMPLLQQADDGANGVTRAGACERDGGPAAGVAPLPEQV